MSKERRRAERFTIQHLIELDYGKEQFIRASGINISSSGLLCTVEPAVELYTRVFLSLKLPTSTGEEIINCEGIVVRSDQVGSQFTTGISFTSFRPEEAEKLVRLLNRKGGSGGKVE
jgi:hypothetical protein